MVDVLVIHCVPDIFHTVMIKKHGQDLPAILAELVEMPVEQFIHVFLHQRVFVGGRFVHLLWLLPQFI